MFVECWTVIILILIMSYMYLRCGKRNFSLAILPLVIVPFVHIIASPISRTIGHGIGISSVMIRCFSDVLAAVIACMIFSFTASKIKNKSQRFGFVFMCAGFTVVFAWVLILYMITPLVK